MVLLHRETDLSEVETMTSNLLADKAIALKDKVMLIDDRLQLIEDQFTRNEVVLDKMIKNQSSGFSEMFHMMRGLLNSLNHLKSPTPMESFPSPDLAEQGISPLEHSENDEISEDVVMDDDSDAEICISEHELISSLERDTYSKPPSEWEPLLELSSLLCRKPATPQLDITTDTEHPIVADLLPLDMEASELTLDDSYLSIEYHHTLDPCPDSKLSSYVASKQPISHQTPEFLTEVLSSDPLLSTLHDDVEYVTGDDCAESGNVSLSSFVDSAVDLSTAGVCENAPKIVSVFAGIECHSIGSPNNICRCHDFQCVWLWFEKPPSWPPDVVRYYAPKSIQEGRLISNCIDMGHVDGKSEKLSIYLEELWRAASNFGSSYELRDVDIMLDWLSRQPALPPDGIRHLTISLDMSSELREIVFRHVKHAEVAITIRIIQDFKWHFNDKTSVCGVCGVSEVCDSEDLICYTNPCYSEFVKAQSGENKEKCMFIGCYTDIKYIYLKFEKSFWWSLNQKGQSSSTWTYDILLHFNVPRYINMIKSELGECRWVIHPNRFNKKLKHRATGKNLRHRITLNVDMHLRNKEEIIIELGIGVCFCLDFLAAMATTVESDNDNKLTVATEQFSVLQSEDDTHLIEDCVFILQHGIYQTFKSPTEDRHWVFNDPSFSCDWFKKTYSFHLVYQTLQVFDVGGHVNMLLRLAGNSIVWCSKDFIPTSSIKGILSVLWLVHVCAQKPNIYDTNEQTERMGIDLMHFDKLAGDFSINECILLRKDDYSKITHFRGGNCVVHMTLQGKQFKVQGKRKFKFHAMGGKKENMLVVTTGLYSFLPCQMMVITYGCKSFGDTCLILAEYGILHHWWKTNHLNNMYWASRLTKTTMSMMNNSFYGEPLIERPCIYAHLKDQEDCASSVLSVLVPTHEVNGVHWLWLTQRILVLSSIQMLESVAWNLSYACKSIYMMEIASSLVQFYKYYEDERKKMVKDGICDLDLLWSRVETEHDMQGGQLVYLVVKEATLEWAATKLMAIVLLNVLQVTNSYLLSLRIRPLPHQIATDITGNISQSVEFGKIMGHEDELVDSTDHSMEKSMLMYATCRISRFIWFTLPRPPELLTLRTRLF